MEAGRRIASFLFPNAILAIRGDLGAGKTTFVQGLAQGLQIDAPIQSPTFVYLSAYEGPLPLFHFDLYRMKETVDFLALGFQEYFDSNGICAIEWPEKIESLLPKRTLFLSLSYQPTGRLLSISGTYPEKLIEWFSVCR